MVAVRAKSTLNSCSPG